MTATGAFEVRTEVFEGPFDLLLHLILADEVDLYEVVVGDIVDAYLAELDRMERLDLEVATEFLLIAATLVQLKSSRLLPEAGAVDLDEELALWSERDLLLARLLECHTFKSAAAALEEMAGLVGRGVARCAGPDERYLGLVPDFLEGVGPLDLRAALVRAVSGGAGVGGAGAGDGVARVSLAHVTDIPFTVNEVVGDLAGRLPGVGAVGFRELTEGLGSEIEVVVYFLAVLELYKRGLVEVSQAATFGRIVVEWCGEDDGAGGGALAGVDIYEG